MDDIGKVNICFFGLLGSFLGKYRDFATAVNVGGLYCHHYPG